RQTGAFVRNIETLTYPRFICCDFANNIWVVHGTNSLQKFPINLDGTLGEASLTLGGLLEPLAVDVKSDNSVVGVCDGSTSEQVKFYNNTTGASTWTFGEAGGYTTNPNVTD